MSGCGCGCVAQKAVHTTNTFHCSHTLPISVIFSIHAIVKLSSVVVSITYLHTQSGESSYLPFTMADIRQSDLPPCIIHISGTCKEVNQTHYTLCIYFVPISLLSNAHCVIWCCVIWCCVLYKVRWVEMNIPYFIRVKEENDKKNRKRFVIRVAFMYTL